MRRQVWSNILSDVAEHGTTVLVSSHNLRELLELQGADGDAALITSALYDTASHLPILVSALFALVVAVYFWSYLYHAPVVRRVLVCLLLALRDGHRQVDARLWPCPLDGSHWCMRMRGPRARACGHQRLRHRRPGACHQRREECVCKRHLSHHRRGGGGQLGPDDRADLHAAQDSR